MCLLSRSDNIMFFKIPKCLSKIKACRSSVVKKEGKRPDQCCDAKKIWQLHIYFIAEKIHTAFIRIPGNSIVSQCCKISLKKFFSKRIKKLRHESAEKLAKMQLPWQLVRTSNAKV